MHAHADPHHIAGSLKRSLSVVLNGGSRLLLSMLEQGGFSKFDLQLMSIRDHPNVPLPHRILNKNYTAFKARVLASLAKGEDPRMARSKARRIRRIDDISHQLVEEPEIPKIHKIRAVQSRKLEIQVKA